MEHEIKTLRDERPPMHSTVEIGDFINGDTKRVMVGSQSWRDAETFHGGGLQYIMHHPYVEPEQVVRECSNCQFWQEQPRASLPYPDTDGWCRRYAPQGPVIKPEAHGWQLFPPMNHDQWCGDYRSNPANTGWDAVKVIDRMAQRRDAAAA